MIITLSKMAVNTVVGSGLSHIIGNAINATTPKAISKAQRVLVVIGGAAISSYVGTKINTHINEEIDEAVEIGKSFKDKFRKKKVEEEPIAE